MFDFLKVTKTFRNSRYYYKPTFITKTSIKDLLVRGQAFYAVFDHSTGFWTKEKARLIEMIDEQVREYAENDVGNSILSDEAHGPVIVQMADSANHIVEQFDRFCKTLGDNQEHMLDMKMLFSNSEVSRKDYATKTLDYPLLA